VIEIIKATIESEKKDTANFWEFYRNYIYKVQDININREFISTINKNHITVANLGLLINETYRNLVILNDRKPNNRYA
jgi:hypothetical protein